MGHVWSPLGKNRRSQLVRYLAAHSSPLVLHIHVPWGDPSSPVHRVQAAGAHDEGGGVSDGHFVADHFLGVPRLDDAVAGNLQTAQGLLALCTTVLVATSDFFPFVYSLSPLLSYKSGELSGP